MDQPIIVVDDDPDFLEILKGKLTAAGFTNVRAEADPVKVAAGFYRGEVVDIALLDMTMPDMDGIALLEVIKNTSPGTECMMVTAVNQARVAVECLRKGAFDYLVKPVSHEDLILSIARALEKKRLLDVLAIEKSRTLPRLSNRKAFAAIVTRSPKVMKVLKEAELHAASEVPVLITGESGTGKELLARAIHAASPRGTSPFKAINMASLTASLFEAEFFGHTRGAFTGAEAVREGYLEHADGGTLFLDEIGSLALDLQGKLLRVLQDGEYMKLGTSRQQKADVRFVAATNEDMDRLLARRAFRKDLYYRIRGGWLHLPPLRERREDVVPLVEGFLTEFGPAAQAAGIEHDALCVLRDYDYPGNIRELRSILQSAVNLAQGAPISLRCLPDHVSRKKPRTKCATESAASPPTLAQVEKTHILTVYAQTDRNKSQTARLLGIGLNTLRRKLKSFGIG